MPVLSTVSTPVCVTLLSADPALYDRLVTLLPSEAFRLSWSDSEPVEPEAATAVYVLDLRDRSGPGRRAWRELVDLERASEAVGLVETEEAAGMEPNLLVWDDLTPGQLARAIRQGHQLAVVRQQLRDVRAELAARRCAQEHLDAERDRQQRLLQGITESLPLLIGRVDSEGRMDELSGGLPRCGIAPARLQGRRVATALPPARQAIRQVAEGQPAAFSLRGREQGQVWHAEFVVLPDPAGAIFVGRDVTERRGLEEQLLTTTDAEKTRIGADLHDGLGQQLTGLACLATALRDRLRRLEDPQLAAQADFIAQVANEATRQSRALARGLCPVQLEGASIESALSDLTFQAEQLHGINCRFRSRRLSGPVDHFTAIHLYRITQEALHNAVRHGKARNVQVTLVSCGPRHRLTVMDDGCGFDARQSAQAVGRGLRLMHYRAGMIGGTVSILSRAGHGTRIQCNFSHFSAPPHEDQR